LGFVWDVSGAQLGELECGGHDARAAAQPQYNGESLARAFEFAVAAVLQRHPAYRGKARVLALLGELTTVSAALAEAAEEQVDPTAVPTADPTERAGDFLKDGARESRCAAQLALLVEAAVARLDSVAVFSALVRNCRPCV
ncbi:hypothetical protein T492DRAFT_866475, partial [Pavlovales sp. CCMP2436]